MSSPSEVPMPPWGSRVPTLAEFDAFLESIVPEVTDEMVRMRRFVEAREAADRFTANLHGFMRLLDLDPENPILRSATLQSEAAMNLMSLWLVADRPPLPLLPSARR